LDIYFRGCGTRFAREEGADVLRVRTRAFGHELDG
jgi:hypothetical protein